MEKRGQASVEYLYTYGWAFLAMLAAVAALNQFGVFDADTYASDYCNTGSQIICLESQLTEEGEFGIILRNDHPVNIEINELNASLFGQTDTWSGSTTIERGNDETIDNIDWNTDLSPGTKEQLTLEIKYAREDGNRNYTIRGSTLTTITSS